jgi:ribosomal protein S18 acetylase RimI-like enzyme
MLLWLYNEGPHAGAFIVESPHRIARMKIEPASFMDINALTRLERACFGRDAWPFLDLIAVLTFPDVIRLKVVENGEMIAFAAGDPRPAEGFSWIATIGVAPEHRRKGIGRELLRACENRLRTPRLRLSVRASNEAAIHLYESEGYSRVDVWHGYYRDGEAAIVMEKARAL